MEKNKIMKLAAFCLPLMLLASCGIKKQIISDSVNNKIREALLRGWSQ